MAETKTDTGIVLMLVLFGVFTAVIYSLFAFEVGMKEIPHIAGSGEFKATFSYYDFARFMKMILTPLAGLPSWLTILIWTPLTIIVVYIAVRYIRGV